MRDPGNLIFTNPNLTDTLEVYLKDILSTFARDQRVLAWDLYNEPGNSGLGLKSMPLLKNVFIWAREIDPSQPLTSGLWNPALKNFNRFQLAHSDIITYHNYNDLKNHKAILIEEFKTKNRTFGAVKCYKSSINGLDSAIVLPLRSHYSNILEVISKDFLRKKLNLKDGDNIELIIYFE